MYFDKEEDHDFLSTTGGSKLANLFGMDTAAAQGGNESFIYTAPKQPKKKETGNSQDASASVMQCSVVHAYKYVEGQYKNQGKLCLAVISNHSNKEYHLLLYISKQQHITNAKISLNFTFTVQPNNYASFYDGSCQSWSVMFESEESLMQCARQIAVAKASSCGSSMTAVISQDLSLGDGGPLEAGDSAEVKYTGWLLTKSSFGQVFDSNVNADKLFRFKLGRGKVIKGWDLGIINMKKSSRRLLVVPPSLAYGQKGMGDKVPPDSTLIFEIEIVRVKLAKGDPAQISPSPTPPLPASESQNDMAARDENVKSRSKSLTEQMSQSPKTDKAKLISRMAKMGQPMLPMMAGTSNQVDSDEELMAESAGAQTIKESFPQSKPVLPAKPVTMPVIGHSEVPALSQQLLFTSPSQQLTLYQPPTQMQPLQQQPIQSPYHPPYGYPNTQSQQPLYNQLYPQQPFPGSSIASVGTADLHAPVILSETRQQNTEVRLVMSKVTDKIDRVLEKLDHMGNSGSTALQNKVPMEAGIVMHNIQRIVLEKEQLKEELMEKSSKIESQNEKIAELLQRSQKYVEQSHSLLEQRNDTFKNTAAQSQARVLALEQEKVQLTTNLSEATAALSSFQMELSGIRKKEMELRQQLGSSLDDRSSRRDEVDRLQVLQAENEKKVSEMAQSLKEERQQRKQIAGNLSQLEEELADMKANNKALEKSLNDKKKKMQEEREKLAEEAEEMKSQFEEEIQALKKKLQSKKVPKNVATAEQEELNDEWQKYDKMVALSEEKNSRALQTVKEENVELEQKIKDLEQKLLTSKASGTQSLKQVVNLQEQVEELAVWKEKYDNLHTQATDMKELYEERINDLNDELDRVQDESRQLHNEQQQTGSVATASVDITSEVKKIMNAVFHGIRDELDVEESYSASEVLSTILGIIKSTTLKLVEQSEEESGDSNTDGSEKVLEERTDTDEEVEQRGIAEGFSESDLVQTSPAQDKTAKSLPIDDAKDEIAVKSGEKSIVETTSGDETKVNKETHSSTAADEEQSVNDNRKSKDGGKNALHQESASQPDAVADVLDWNENESESPGVAEHVDAAVAPKLLVDKSTEDMKPKPPPLFDDDYDDDVDWLG